MKRLTEDDVREIQQIHSRWVEFEVAREDRCLLALCTDDIEFWPPDAPPVLGRTAVSAQLARGSTRIHGIEISGRRILGSNEIAYLTASYKTTFSSAEDSTLRQAFGSHLLDTGKAGRWVGACSRELVSVGTCRHVRDSSTASVRQRRVHILKTGNPEVIRQVPFLVCRLFGSHFTPGIPITGETACQPVNL